MCPGKVILVLRPGIPALTFSLGFVQTHRTCLRLGQASLFCWNTLWVDHSRAVFTTCMQVAKHCSLLYLQVLADACLTSNRGSAKDNPFQQK